MTVMKTFIALLTFVCVLIEARSVEEETDSRYADYFEESTKRMHLAPPRQGFWIDKPSPSAECSFKGYTPNGPIKDIGKIKPPKATANAKKGLKAVLGGAAARLGKAAGVTMHAIKFVESIGKAAPMLGPALGVFSALSGVFNKKLSPQDILDKVNTAIEELANEVNQKLDQMEGYVDSKVAKAERELITAEYKSSFRLWAQCIEEANEEEGTKCQRDAVRHLVAKRPKFTPESDSLKRYTISFEKVRKLEAYMLAFRDYANLMVMQLSPLLEYYCVARKSATDSAHYCDMYSNKMITEVNFFITYARQAIAAIKKGHWGTSSMGNCPNTQTCEYKDIWEGWLIKYHAAYRVICKCEIESANTKKYCTVSTHVRRDVKTPKGYTFYKYNIPRGDFKKAGEMFNKRMLKKYSLEYQKKNHKIMEKYWQGEVLDFVSEWEKAIGIAKEMKQKNPNGDQARVLDVFSPRYQSRLDASGHRFVDVEKIENFQEDVTEY